MTDFRVVRTSTMRLLSKRKVPINPNLPLLDVDIVRTPTDVARKIISLYALTGLANDASPALLKEWLQDEGAWGFLTEIEQSYFSQKELHEEVINELSWKQESLCVLVWAGGIVKDLGWPVRECDLTDAFTKIPPELPVHDFINTFKLKRGKVGLIKKYNDVVKMLDLYYCLHASFKHPELWGRESDITKTIKGEVVIERRHALEWLCSEKDWDDIALDT